MREYKDDYEKGYLEGKRTALNEARKLTARDAMEDDDASTRADNNKPITMADVMNACDYELENGKEFERTYGMLRMTTDKYGHPTKLELFKGETTYPPINSENYNITESMKRLKQFKEDLDDIIDCSKYFKDKIKQMELAIKELKTKKKITRKTIRDIIF